MVTTDRPVGLSVWEGQLYASTIVDHITARRSVLDRCTAISPEGPRVTSSPPGADRRGRGPPPATCSSSGPTRSLTSDPRGSRAPSTASRTPSESTTPAAARAVDDLLAVEKHDRRQLRALQGEELKDVRSTTIWPLVLELMQLDTEKHIKILEYLRGRAARHAR